MTTPTLMTATAFKGTGSVLVKFDFDGPVPRTGTFLVGIFGARDNPYLQLQFGLKLLDGEQIAYFINDTHHQVNFEGEVPIIDPTTIAVPYPLSRFDELGPGATYRAYVNYEGRDFQTDVPVQFEG